MAYILYILNIIWHFCSKVMCGGVLEGLWAVFGVSVGSPGGEGLLGGNPGQNTSFQKEGMFVFAHRLMPF